MGGLPTNKTVNGFAVDPENSKTMFMAMRDGLFKSTDAGASWKVIGNRPKNLAAVTIHPTKPAEMYLATMEGIIYASADAGMKWKRQQ